MKKIIVISAITATALFANPAADAVKEAATNKAADAAKEVIVEKTTEVIDEVVKVKDDANETAKVEEKAAEEKAPEAK